jgi:hypothetical protein
MFTKYVNLLISPKATSLLKHCASEKRTGSGILGCCPIEKSINYDPLDLGFTRCSVGQKIGFHSPSSGKNHAAYYKCPFIGDAPI